MPLPVTAPYDTLATVTQQVRTLLGDFIQGINPNVSGVVNANGTAVTWVSGNKFTYLLVGTQIIINQLPYAVLAVNSAVSLTLFGTAGVQVASTYSAVLPTGDIFSDSQAYVLPVLNLAWRKAKTKLADRNHPRLENEVDLFSLPIVTNLDPMAQQWISWTQFFDGTGTQITPTLPADFISPLQLWERPSVTSGTNFNRPRPMHPAPGSLRSRAKGSWNRFWDWREDAIYFPGALLNLDVRIRYTAGLPDLVLAGGGFAATIVPILGAAEAIANYAAAIFTVPRGGQVAPKFDADGDAVIAQITNSFAKLQQRASYSRIPWGGRRRSFTRF